MTLFISLRAAGTTIVATALAACSPSADTSEAPARDASGMAGTETSEAQSYTHMPFTQAAFEAAQAANKPILIDVFAPWCPTCKEQQKGIAEAANDPANRDLLVFRLDYDSQKEEGRAFRITRQSTLIAFKGTKETGRGIAITSPMEIGKVVATTR